MDSLTKSFFFLLAIENGKLRQSITKTSFPTNLLDRKGIYMWIPIFSIERAEKSCIEGEKRCCSRKAVLKPIADSTGAERSDVMPHVSWIRRSMLSEGEGGQMELCLRQIIQTNATSSFFLSF